MTRPEIELQPVQRRCRRAWRHHPEISLLRIDRNPADLAERALRADESGDLAGALVDDGNATGGAVRNEIAPRHRVVGERARFQQRCE